MGQLLARVAAAAAFSTSLTPQCSPLLVAPHNTPSAHTRLHHIISSCHVISCPVLLPCWHRSTSKPDPPHLHACRTRVESRATPYSPPCVGAPHFHPPPLIVCVPTQPSHCIVLHAAAAPTSVLCTSSPAAFRSWCRPPGVLLLSLRFSPLLLCLPAALPAGSALQPRILLPD